MENERGNEPEPPTTQDSGGSGGGGQQAETEGRLPGRDPVWGERGQRQGEHKQERTQKQ
jgi:hypothetical protein